MKIVNIKVTFEETFSGAKMIKEFTRCEDTFKKMQKSVGSIVNQFENNINYHWRIKKVEQI